jgi:hypothetical protein
MKVGGGTCFPQSGRARCSERFPMPSVARRHACQPPSWTAREMPSPLSDAGCTLRPTHRLSVSRCSVTPLGHPSTAQSNKAPPAGLEPAASGLRVRRHHPFDHGGMQLRRQGSNLRLAINSRASYRSTTPERNGGSRIRTCGRAAHACALAPRCLNPLAGKRSYRQSRHDLLSDVASAVAASKTEGEGVEPPRPRSPPVFETGYRTIGSPANVWPRQDSNLHHTD